MLDLQRSEVMQAMPIDAREIPELIPSRFYILAGVHGSRTHPGRGCRPATVLKTAEPTGTLPLPSINRGSYC